MMAARVINLNPTPAASSDPPITFPAQWQEADVALGDLNLQDVADFTVSATFPDIGGNDMEKQDIHEAAEILCKKMKIDPPGDRVIEVIYHTFAAFIRVSGSGFIKKYCAEDRTEGRDVASLTEELASSINQLYVIARSCSDIETRAYMVVEQVLACILIEARLSEAKPVPLPTSQDYYQDEEDNVDMLEMLILMVQIARIRFPNLQDSDQDATEDNVGSEEQLNLLEQILRIKKTRLSEVKSPRFPNLQDSDQDATEDNVDSEEQLNLLEQKLKSVERRLANRRGEDWREQFKLEKQQLKFLEAWMENDWEEQKKLKEQKMRRIIFHTIGFMIEQEQL